MAAEHVILIHGVWMRGFTLSALRRRLEASGYTTELFEYASVTGRATSSAARLADRMRRHDAAAVHLVGHSLGGLMALQAVRQGGELPPGRVVCLGSPLKGSAAARGVSRWPGGSQLLGRSLDLLREGLDEWRGERAVGVIAGSLPFGLGVVIGLPKPNDGTVSVEETRLAGIADHRELPVTHTGMLFSSAVARMTAHFLRDANFGPA
ncbi:esterase/lipase family protein [Tahibacter amnicola]|uniref:Alpha/beta fold hydrolase n=1 Tax=Tahibacter amnicola TaxID=2976241 RepID=A0ABY6BEJ3_9GAMM|nr:alpha/beta fold hydrolase [Tahibacter amnicola]UXI67678.1 alpha/beta fold hydrolase [Tahibacter amnicola]